MSRPQYYFVHLPKCAGTSLLKSLGRMGKRRLIIVSRFPQSKRSAMEGLNQQLTQRRLSICDPDLIFGHDVFCGIHQTSSRQVRYATIMRSPVSRWISQYRYIVDCSQNPKSPIHDYSRDAVICDGQTLTMAQCADRGNWTNMMANYLAAAMDPDLDSARWGIDCDRRIETMALTMVDQMHFVGFVDQIDDAEATISGWFGLRPKLKKVNVSRARVDSHIDDRTREKIAAINQIDQTIYEAAKVKMGR